MASYKKYPIYVLDEPITYADFSGGINTDPSNEHLANEEMRDCVNMHYRSGALVKRPGAKLLTTIFAQEDIKNVQSVSLFTHNNTYIVIAADGKLYYGIYSPSTTINITRLPIKFGPPNEGLVHDPRNMKVNLDVKEVGDAIEIFHNGYIYRTETKTNVVDFYELEAGDVVTDKAWISKDGKIFEFRSSVYEGEGTIPQDFIVSFRIPGASSLWEEFDELVLTEEQLLYVLEWDEDYHQYIKNDIVKVTTDGVTEYYVAKETHNTMENYDAFRSQLFQVMFDQDELIFQNQKEIESATYDNKLYFATGTRIVEVFAEKNNTLSAVVVQPKQLNPIEAQSVGYNYLSPYPIFNVASDYTASTTSINWLLPIYRIINNKKRFFLVPTLMLAQNKSIEELYWRWEKFDTLTSTWRTLITFKSNITKVNVLNKEGTYELTNRKVDFSTLEVSDADESQYRVSFCEAFDYTIDPENPEQGKIYIEEELVDKDGYITTDWVINKISGGSFGSATSVLYNTEMQVDQLFSTIQSCKKITNDGNKFLLYDDDSNSGEWFKTIIDKPNYITLRGGLSFKTNKNEKLIKVVPFYGNLIAFANSEKVGGSIHLVKGAGDDIESDQFYSPYRRRTIVEGISCDNPKTIQVCENVLFFKHFDSIYFIEAGELDNDKISLYTANDKVKLESRDVTIPWDDNDCITEVTEDYYGILWPEKLLIENGELTQVHPAMRVKLYYKQYRQSKGKVYFSWLRDESEIFNSRHIFYVNRKPIYLYNNALVGMHFDYYKDINEIYESKIRFKGYNLGHGQLAKFLDSLTICYQRNQNSDIDFQVEVKNEAGHTLLKSNYKNDSVQDIKNLRLGDVFGTERVRLDSTIIDTKVFNVPYRFPFLFAEAIVTSETEREFSIASLTFNYITVENADTTPYDLYSSILRKED